MTVNIPQDCLLSTANCKLIHHTQICRPAALLPQPLDGFNNPGCNRCNRPVSIYFREAFKSPVMLDDRGSLRGISAHSLHKDLLGIIGTLNQSYTIQITKPVLLRGSSMNVVDALAGRAVSATGDAPQ